MCNTFSNQLLLLLNYTLKYIKTSLKIYCLIIIIWTDSGNTTQKYSNFYLQLLSTGSELLEMESLVRRTPVKTKRRTRASRCAV